MLFAINVSKKGFLDGLSIQENRDYQDPDEDPVHNSDVVKKTGGLS